MKSQNVIVFPAGRLYIVLPNVCGIALLVLETDCFSKPINDGDTIVGIAYFVAAFCMSLRRVALTESELRVMMWKLPIIRIHRSKISCVEVVEWQRRTHIIFEIGNCPCYGDGPLNSLSDYLMIYFFKTVEYIVPGNNREDVISKIQSLQYPIVEADMSNKF